MVVSPSKNRLIAPQNKLAERPNLKRRNQSLLVAANFADYKQSVFQR